MTSHLCLIPLNTLAFPSTLSPRLPLEAPTQLVSTLLVPSSTFSLPLRPSEALANLLSPSEVATVVSHWTRAGWLIAVMIEAGGEPSIKTLQSHTGRDRSLIPLNQKDQ